MPGTAQLEAIARRSGTRESLSQTVNAPLPTSTAVQANRRAGQRSCGKPAKESAKLATNASSLTAEVSRAHAPISRHTSSFGRTPE